MLVATVCSLLITQRSGVYVDGTLGGGGHAEAILRELAPGGRLIGLDVDGDALRFAATRLEAFRDKVIIKKSNFKDLKPVLREMGIERVDGVILDLGVSSFQLDEPAKGFSFRSDGRLDMRMDGTQALDAYQVLNEYPERELEEILRKYGEERQSRRIAKAIVQQRKTAAIRTTGELADIVERIAGGRFLTKSLARVFQAIRIEVNRELEYLKTALADAIEVLRPAPEPAGQGGRLVVISYHSLEDRIVKETFKSAAATTIPSGIKIVPDTPAQPILRILTKKPVEASAEELRLNSRARSAKLRAAERI